MSRNSELGKDSNNRCSQAAPAPHPVFLRGLPVYLGTWQRDMPTWPAALRAHACLPLCPGADHQGAPGGLKQQLGQKYEIHKLLKGMAGMDSQEAGGGRMQNRFGYWNNVTRCEFECMCVNCPHVPEQLYCY